MAIPVLIPNPRFEPKQPHGFYKAETEILMEVLASTKRKEKKLDSSVD